jgi:ribosomal protein S18 acetylase RimI-like enzyme
MNIVIKEEKNIDTIIKLNKYVQDIHHENHSDIFKKYDYESMAKSLGEYLKQEYIQSILVYNDKVPIGYAVYFRRNYPEHLFKKGHCSIYIDQICVKPEYQKKGIGKKIINKIKQYCQENGINRIELSVWSDNQNAKSFFSKSGFDIYLENMKMDL